MTLSTSKPKCKKCGEEKTETSTHRFYCKSCSSLYHKNRRIADPETLRARARAYCAKNKEKIRLHSERYAKKNMDKILKYRNANKDKTKARLQKWRKENPERYKAQWQNSTWEKHPLYDIWDGVNRRCSNRTHQAFSNYGGRGISVYPGWLKIPRNTDRIYAPENSACLHAFADYIENFLGSRPSKDYTIDRIDNDGNYEPGNITWATRKEQAFNTRKKMNNRKDISSDIIVEMGGRCVSLYELSELTGISLGVVKDRYAIYGDVPTITNERKLLHRKFAYKGIWYTYPELGIIANLPLSIIHSRLRDSEWTIEKTIETPLV